MQIAILGRQPEISLAELECLFGSEQISPVASYAALIQTATPLPQQKLGGTMKSAQLIARLKNTSLEAAFAQLGPIISDIEFSLPEGKMQLGVSIYGFKAQKNWLLRQLLTLKKEVRKIGRSVRIIENKSEALETAQVLYNKLAGSLGIEILIIKDGNDALIARTTAVQNIDDYAARDHGRPMRDSYVGMLPPKLAQIMINLAKPSKDSLVLDPFCGTGVVLQEALLMDSPAYGTDISEKMIDYSSQNLQWLQESWKLKNKDWKVEHGDATSFVWNFVDTKRPDASICVATETYLGKPLTSLPNQRQLDEIIDQANKIAEGFLKNIGPQLASGSRLCVALPAWHLGDSGFRHLKVLDHLENLGYNRLDLVHASKRDLIYHRENQVVARELTILEKV